MFSVYVSLLTKYDCSIQALWKLFYQLRLAICGLKKLFFHVLELCMLFYNVTKNCTDFFSQHTSFPIILLLLSHIQSSPTLLITLQMAHSHVLCPGLSHSLCLEGPHFAIFPPAKFYDLAQAPFLLIFNSAFRNIIKST